MMERAVVILKDLYEGETLHVVGKGPSLRYLRAEHFGDGPVMTMNEAILPVQALGLVNNIFSMQKDGCKSVLEGMRCIGTCIMSWPMVYPNQDVAVILQDPEYSEHCLPEHPMRLFVDPVNDLHFEEASEMSIRICIALGKIMGCARIVFLCCDSLAIGNYETYDIRDGKTTEEVSGHYAAVVPMVMADLENFPHEFITPAEKAETI